MNVNRSFEYYCCTSVLILEPSDLTAKWGKHENKEHLIETTFLLFYLMYKLDTANIKNKLDKLLTKF